MDPLLLIVRYGSNLSAIPAVITGSERRGLLWYYACLSLVCDALSFCLKNFGICKHYHVTNVFWVLEFAIVAAFLLQAIGNAGLLRIGQAVVVVAALYFIARTSLAFPHRCNFDDAAILYCCEILLCMIALHHSLNEIEYLRIERSPLFVFAAAYLVYASMVLFLILFTEYLDENFSKQTVGKIWTLHNSLNILKNLAVARVLYLSRKSARFAVGC